MVGTLTLDVEDWEHANFSQLRGKEGQIASRQHSLRYSMDANVDRWIQVLDQARAKSTCFVLGEFAERYPAAVKKLSDAGHEIASHGATHDLIYEMNRSQFDEFLKKGIKTLEDLTGKKVKVFVRQAGQ